MSPTNQPSSQPTSGTQPGYSNESAVISPQTTAVKNSPSSTQNALQISEIRDGVVIMNDGSFRAVVMCKSINFDLMSPQEREAVEFSYQGFLNSLYFPVQIFIRSQKVDLRPYLERLDKTRSEQDNMLLGLLMEDYIAFLSDIAQQTNIMDKKFYLVIKYPDIDQNIRKAIKTSTGFFTGLADLFNPGKATHVVIDEGTLETAKTELRNRVQAVMQGLAEAGIQSLPLDTEELIELYYDAYNPDTATRQQLKNFDDLSSTVVTKGEGAAPQPNLDGGVA
jgi:type IV secretory pathway VirB4 component